MAEVFQSFPSLDDPAYIVNAFFEDDRRVLSAKEVDFGLWALEQTRHDLRQAVSRFGPGQLTRPIAPAPKDTLERILHHLAHAEWWYFDRLGLADPPRWEDVSGDPLARLERVRAGARAVLPTLTGDARVTTRVGEQWSARKVLRRMLWHERDHTRQISLIDPASL